MNVTKHTSAGGDEVLRVENLSTDINTAHGIIRPVDGVSLTLRRGRVRALVGKSGSGKTITALSLMRLIRPPSRIISGKILLEGRDLLVLSEREIQRARGSEIAMVFQDPMTYLNPVFRIGSQLMETVQRGGALSHSLAKRRVLELLDVVRDRFSSDRVQCLSASIERRNEAARAHRHGNFR